MSNMAGIRIDLTREFGDFGLKVDLLLPGRGVNILFGASGCGKTTLLRGIAGLDPKVRGQVSVNGEIWSDTQSLQRVPTHRRSIGFVFQEAALFPHLKVRENLDYGMKRAGAGREGPPEDQVIHLLELGPLLNRYPAKLSGGEMQRVAIARALLSRPKLLLMDEPLASLDLTIKGEFLHYLERLHQELDIPVIYVTHAPDEVLRLADYVAILDQGRLTAAGTVEEMLPVLAMRPGFGDSAGTMISALVDAHHPSDGITELRFQGGRLWVPLLPMIEGHRVRCRILPRDVSLSIHAPVLCSVLNILPARVESLLEMEGDANVLVRLDLNGTLILSSITRKSARELDLRPGQSLYAQIKATTLSK